MSSVAQRIDENTAKLNQIISSTNDSLFTFVDADGKAPSVATISEIPSAIDSIYIEGPTSISLHASDNGLYTPDVYNADYFDSVEVDVPSILSPLSSPASSSDIIENREAYDSNGDVITGTYVGLEQTLLSYGWHYASTSSQQDVVLPANYLIDGLKQLVGINFDSLVVMKRTPTTTLEGEILSFSSKGSVGSGVAVFSGQETVFDSSSQTQVRFAAGQQYEAFFTL